MTTRIADAPLEELSLDADALSKDVNEGRQEEIEGVSAQAAPFFDLVGRMAFRGDGIPAAHAGRAKQRAHDVIDLVQGTINVVKHWNSASAYCMQLTCPVS